MVCRKCGYDNKLNNEHCANCGGVLEIYARINKVIIILPLIALVLTLFATYAMMVTNNEDLSLFIIFDIYLIIMCINRIIKILTTILWLNDKKVYGKVGLFNTTSLEAPLDKINDVIIGQTLVGKIFGYSRIIISTSSSKYVYDFISNAEIFRDYLNDYSEKFKHMNNSDKKDSVNKYDELEKLKKLLDKSVITNEEYEIEKKKIFNKQ